MKKSALENISYNDEFTTLLRSRDKNFKPLYNSKSTYNQTEFSYNDITKWLLKKEIITHGYDNTVSDFYWRQKDLGFNKKLIHFPATVKEFSNNSPHLFENDDQYAKAIFNQINNTELVFYSEPNTLPITISKHKNLPLWANIQPNNLMIELTSDESNQNLVLTNRLSRGWKVFINNKEGVIEKVNKVFMGVNIKNAGHYKIEFKYMPLTVTLVKIFYFAFFTLVLTLFIQKNFIKKDLISV